MFTPTFDWIMGAIFLVLAVVFFMGKGQGVLELFSGKYKPKKMDPEQNIKYQRATGIFLLILGIDEIFMALFPGQVMGIVTIIVSVIALIGIVFYMRKLLG